MSGVFLKLNIFYKGNAMRVVGRFTGIFSIAVLLALAGCASAPQAPISVGLDLGADKTFTYRNVDADGKKISDGYFPIAIQNAIYESSNYGKLKVVVPGTNINKIQGIEVSGLLNSSEFKLSYVNGEKYNTGNVYATRSTALFGYSVLKGTDTYTIKITAPKQVETKLEKNPIFISYNPLASDEMLVNDVKKIYTSINPKIALVKSFKGEINSDYSVDATTANFKRKCSPLSSRVMGGYSCMVGGHEVILEIFPYKAGSKATYQFDMRYFLDGQGGSSYSTETSNNFIAALEKIVKE